MATVDLSKKTVNLSKGEKINLSKSNESGLKSVMIGLGWDPAENGFIEREVTKEPGFIGKLFGAKPTTVTERVRAKSVGDIDCDAWLALLKDGKLADSKDIIYYGKKELTENGNTVIKHHGDNLTGEGDGDDEEITIDLSQLPNRYNGIIIGVTIYQGKQRHQSFGIIKNTFVRVVDEKDNFEICRFDQGQMADNKDSLTFIAGKLYKDKGEWQFEAVGKCTMDETISEAASHYMYKN
jgi:stress response protein SCP2